VNLLLICTFENDNAGVIASLLKKYSTVIPKKKEMKEKFMAFLIKIYHSGSWVTEI